MEVDRNGLEVLDRTECLRLLGTATLGRIGFTSRALPTVLPVNFHLDGERIIVRTGRGGKLDTAAHEGVVAFEVDEFDPIYHSGWSVAVTGVASVLRDPAELDRVAHQPVSRWAPAGAEAVIVISTEVVSGRRLGTD